jgi:serine/threonine-protein kinase
VLRSLGQRGVHSSRVLLREESSGDAPLVNTRSLSGMSGPEGRYQVLGEIARGGMGLVLKSRDTDLGRDVAMKVLRDEFIGHPEVVQRFVEEAQIGGQLQHPGVVPVYEMGLRADGHPYFTMKLIKGRTLASLLGERKDPSQDRRRILRIFETVCQTLAYAHSRGVVHRDLKPANIMVGAFGEVLVMDWGLAKVMGQGSAEDARREHEARARVQTIIETVRSGPAGTHSRVGSVMGTPDYMPPEQARGDVEHLDERSDVFALGAILCEVLTGRPPYSGSDTEVVLQAARAQLDEARSRLASCGADASLVTLCEACLSPAPRARPRDAGEVAKEVTAWLASVEDRERAAEEDAAEARAHADEHRKVRRLVVILAASVLGVVVAGGAGFLFFQLESAARSGEASARVEEALQAVHDQRGRAAGGSLALWSDARNAARNAVKLAEDAGVDPTTREAAARALAEVEEAEGRAREDAARREAEAALETRLDSLRIESLLGPDLPAEESFASAFREGGIDPESPGRAAAVARARGSRLASRIADAAADWALVRRVHGLPDAAWRSFARDAEPDAWLAELRDARGIEEVEKCAASAGSPVEPARGMPLARALAGAGAPDRAVAVLRGLRWTRPGDFWVDALLGELLLRHGDPANRMESIRCLTGALALRPGEPVVRDRLGTALLAASLDAEAEALLRRAVAIAPRDFRPRASLALLRLLRGDPAGALEEARAAVAMAPSSGAAAAVLGRALLESGKFRESVESLARAGSAGADLLQEAERMVSIEPRVPALTRKNREQAGTADALAAAACCARLGRHAASADLYAAAFADDEKSQQDGSPSARVRAARSAALAGCGASEDGRARTAEDRARWRLQAREWLRADLGVRRSEIWSRKGGPYYAAFAELRRWRTDRALAGIRDPGGIDALPEEERGSFRALWEDLDAALYGGYQ